MTNDLALTGEEQEQLTRAAWVALSRKRLLPYCMGIDPAYTVVPHIQKTAEVLEAVERGEQLKVIIVAPPRGGKSDLVSGKFPSWCLGRDPSRSFIGTSWGADLAADKFSVSNRDTILYNEFFRLVFPDVYVDPNRRNKQTWTLAGSKESYRAAGIDGGVTGFGAWCLSIDDPIKDYKMAQSATSRQAAWDWYLTVSRTRLTPDGRIIIIQTRWHEDDLVGRILNSAEAEEYHVLHIPALSYGMPEDYKHDNPTPETYAQRVEHIPKHAFPDPLGRTKGEALSAAGGKPYSVVFNREYLEKSRLLMDSKFEAIYQGHPGTPSGEKFKRDWFRSITPDTLFRLPVTKIMRGRSYDLAWSAKTSADYTVGLRATLYKLDSDKLGDMSPEDQNIFDYGPVPPVMCVIEAVDRWQKEWDDSADDIRDLAIHDGPKYELYVEAVASQNIGVKSLMLDKALWKHNIFGVQPKGDKEERAKYSLRLGKMGIFFILFNVSTVFPPWRKDFLNELGLFPNGANDDQVDALTQIINRWEPYITEIILATQGYVGVVWETPFMKTGGAPVRKNPLPLEFRRDTDTLNDSPRQDELGWRQYFEHQ